jgi:hypothetical protein
MVGSGTLDSLVNAYIIFRKGTVPHHVSQAIEARNVGQTDLLLPGR